MYETRLCMRLCCAFILFHVTDYIYHLYVLAYDGTLYYVVKIFKTIYFVVKIFETILFHVLDFISSLLCLLYSMYQTTYDLRVYNMYNAPKSRRT
jgi:hypothetical protein